MTGVVRTALTEALGTFLFVFSVVAAVNDAGALAPIAIGFTLMVLVYATGHISGGHLNPAVTLGAWLRGAISIGGAVAYWIAQFVGAALAALLSFAVFPAAGKGMALDLGPAFLVELVFTFILVFVVLNVATSKSTDGNSFYGLAIGGVVVVGAFAVGPVSGGGFNPAIALGLTITGHFGWSSYWLYLLAPLVGGALAAGAYRLLDARDRNQKETVTAAE